MKVRKNTTGTVVLTFFGAIFILLFIAAVAILEEVEMSQQQMHAGFVSENGAGHGKYPDLNTVSPAPPIRLPIDNDKQGLPISHDFLSDSLRKDFQSAPGRFEPLERGIQP
jgi:hypothetical protein